MNLIKSLYRSTEERINNPLIGAFFTSWIVLNWKPILFIIFSSRNIEDKIDYIKDNFSNNSLILFWPFGIALFYVIGLPYLNWLFEVLSNKAVTKRNELATDKTINKLKGDVKIEIQKSKVENAKQDYEEQKNYNEIIDSLSLRINNLENENHGLTLNNNETIDILRNELAESKKRENQLISSYERKLSDFEKTMIDVRVGTNKIANRIKNITYEISDLKEEQANLNDEFASAHLSDKIRQLERERSIAQNQLNESLYINIDPSLFNGKTNI